MAGRPREQLKEPFTGRATALGNHLNPAVGQVRGTADQTEFERPRANPPPKAHALHPASDPSGQPDLLALSVSGMSSRMRMCSCTAAGTGICTGTVTAHGSTVTPPAEPNDVRSSTPAGSTGPPSRLVTVSRLS